MKVIYLLLISYCFSQTENYIHYYADGNYVDGRPMINQANLLRFFPVYTFRQSTKKITVRIFYGNNKQSGPIEARQEDIYWQAILPDFQLGEAINRIEVEQISKLPEHIEKQVDRINDEKRRYEQNLSLELKAELTYEIQNIMRQNLDDLKDSKGSFQENLNSFNEKFKQLNEKIDSDSLKIDIWETEDIVSYYENEISKIESKAIKEQLNFSHKGNILNDKLFNKFNDNIRRYNQIISDKSYSNINTLSIIDLTKELNKVSFIRRINELNDTILERWKLLNYNMLNYQKQHDNYIKNRIQKEIFLPLSDSSMLGKNITKSDIIYDIDGEEIKILYQNYNYNLRKLNASDPSEKMGIFRARYVPFVMAGTPNDNEVRLRGNLEGKSAVFEFAINFGDTYISSDRFVASEFSASRLGITFALSQDIFDTNKENPDVLALALSYDFSSYASISYGKNLSAGEKHDYFSLGINEKAFTDLLKSIYSLFHDSSH